MNPIKQRLKQSKPLIGTLLTLGLPAIAEMIQLADLIGCGLIWSMDRSVLNRFNS